MKALKVKKEINVGAINRTASVNQRQLSSDYSTTAAQETLSRPVSFGI